MSLNSPKFVSQVKRVLFLAAGWLLAWTYIHFIQLVSISMIFKIAHVNYVFETNYLLKASAMFVVGLILASVEVFYFTDRFKKKSFTYAVLMKSLYYAVVLMVFTLLMSLFMSVTSKDISDFLLDHIGMTLLVTLLIWGPIFLVSSVFLQITDRFGPGVFWKFVRGRYHLPKKENRIFMFLDMKSSTTIAEILGSVKYFELINELFYDVTDAIVNTGGEVYQYVGDEIVISWSMKSGSANANCLKCFFDINEVLKRNSEKYKSKFGVVPTFKAGVHCGEVTIGEVGVQKRDIVFSGDVLNTTSRIQEFCNKFNEKLIASKDIKELLNEEHKFQSHELGEMNLRGRSEAVTLYKIVIDGVDNY